MHELRIFLHTTIKNMNARCRDSNINLIQHLTKDITFKNKAFRQQYSNTQDIKCELYYGKSNSKHQEMIERYL